MRHLGEIETHLDARQRAHQHQIVEVADMADPEHLALDLVQAGAKRHVEVFEHHFTEIVGVMAFRHDDAGQRGRMRTLFLALRFQPQTLMAARVAALWRLWRAKTFSSPSSSSILIASRNPNSRLVAGV